MKTGRFLPALLFVLLLPLIVSSKVVPISTARLVATNFCIQNGHPSALSFPGDAIAPGSGITPVVRENHPLYYCFNLQENKGFLIIAADDRMPPVLAYSFAGGAAERGMPPACAGFMAVLELDILHAITSDAAPSDETVSQWSRLGSVQPLPVKQATGIGPLVSTRWGQGCFYNAGCPNDTAATATCLHAQAGSGATAMAQVMKYYQYPAHGSGEHGYTHPKYGIQYANFGATTYNYTSMPDSLNSPNDVVSTLLYQCGVAQNMNYGVTFSSSDTAAIDTAFIKYFAFPATAAWKKRANYPAADWLAMLKTELDASHPLVYQSSDLAGRINYYICDGYQGADYFHFNWGWGGAYDGYYYLDNLMPGSNLTNFQGAIFNLAPSPPAPTGYTMDFETVPDFSLTFSDWTVKDMDGHDTYGIENHSFPHQSEPMAFLSFNPATVTPAMTADQAIQPHGGQRFGACFSSNPPSNSDWFISPQVQLGSNGSYSFWIKSYNDTYGVDDYFVAVSTGDNNPASFTVISGPDTLHTTTGWVKKTFSLAAYNNQKVYAAIHCVSKDHFLMMIDDLEVKTQGSSTITADFSADRTSLMAGESVNFTDQSAGGPVSWTWTFTGGTPATSALQNPSGITYQVPGTYPVKLKVSNGSSSDSVTKSAFISVTGFPSSMSLDFESLADFTLSFLPWTLIDVKGGNTYGIQSVTFPNNYYPMSYICFNPAKTLPPLTNMQAHSGQKLGCCFSTVPVAPPLPAVTPNDKWLITPHMTLGTTPLMEFWVKSYNTQFGSELYNVAVSTTDPVPASFVPLTAAPEASPADWTKRSYDLSAYTGQNVYIGIQCVTNDGFIFMIDDISITSTVGVDEKGAPGRFTIYPNPAKDQVTLRPGKAPATPLTIVLVNTLGEEVRSWNQPETRGNITLILRDVKPGMYILKISDGKETVNRKLTIIN
jgi:PKD repeat protein